MITPKRAFEIHGMDCTEEVAIAKGMEAGFFRYLTKPINVAEFMATIDVALDHAPTEPRPS